MPLRTWRAGCLLRLCGFESFLRTPAKRPFAGRGCGFGKNIETYQLAMLRCAADAFEVAPRIKSLRQLDSEMSLFFTDEQRYAAAAVLEIVASGDLALTMIATCLEKSSTFARRCACAKVQIEKQRQELSRVTRVPQRVMGAQSICFRRQCDKSPKSLALPVCSAACGRTCWARHFGNLNQWSLQFV